MMLIGCSPAPTMSACKANGLNVHETATRLKVSKTALYAALQAAQAAQT